VKFVSDPPISVKVRKMNERVRWQEKSIADRAIDQTKIILDDGVPDIVKYVTRVVEMQGNKEIRTIYTL